MKDRSGIAAYKEMVDTDVVRERIAELIDMAAAFYPEPIEDLFVSEFREQEGRQVIESVWMFTENWAIEFKDALQQDNFDLTPLKKSITWMEASRKDFDFASSSDQSRFSVRFLMTSGIEGKLSATQNNCLELLRITKDRLIPNVASPPVLGRSRSPF